MRLKQGVALKGNKVESITPEVDHRLDAQFRKVINNAVTDGQLSKRQAAKVLRDTDTPRSVEITIDHLPARELSPNSRCHWSFKRLEVKAARQEIGWLAKQYWHDDKAMMKARISYMFHFKDNRKHDLDNLIASCKAYQDGLIDAGVIFYDDAAHLEIGSVKAEVTGHEEFIVTVEEI